MSPLRVLFVVACVARLGVAAVGFEVLTTPREAIDALSRALRR